MNEQNKSSLLIVLWYNCLFNVRHWTLKEDIILLVWA